jgi:hypothetical protein
MRTVPRLTGTSDTLCAAERCKEPVGKDHPRGRPRPPRWSPAGDLGVEALFPGNILRFCVVVLMSGAKI